MKKKIIVLLIILNMFLGSVNFAGSMNINGTTWILNWNKHSHTYTSISDGTPSSPGGNLYLGDPPNTGDTIISSYYVGGTTVKDVEVLAGSNIKSILYNNGGVTGNFYVRGNVEEIEFNLGTAPGGNCEFFFYGDIDRFTVLNGSSKGVKGVHFYGKVGDIGLGYYNQGPFQGANISSLSLPSTTINTLGKYAFKDNELTTVEFKAGVANFSESVFENNNISTIKGLNYLTIIPKRTFANNNLTTIEFPSSITTLKTGAFVGNNISRVIIPDTITTMDNNVFDKSVLIIAPIGSIAHQSASASGNPVSTMAEYNSIYTTKNSSGHYGITLPEGDNSSWLRSTSNGFLPYSNGHSSLGTSSWRFNQAHINTIYENGVSLASKYASKGDVTTLQTNINNINSKFAGAIAKSTFKTLNTGWYTIAKNTGSRASADFVILEKDSGSHQTVRFNASHNYGKGNTINVTSNSSYSGNGSFRYIRIKDKSTYDGALLQVYVDRDSVSNCQIIKLNEFQSTGWELVDWASSDPIPGLAEVKKIDLDKVTSFATTEEMVVDGYEVSHIGNSGQSAIVVEEDKVFKVVLEGYTSIPVGSHSATVTVSGKGNGWIELSGTYTSPGVYTEVISGSNFIFKVINTPTNSNVNVNIN